MDLCIYLWLLLLQLLPLLPLLLLQVLVLQGFQLILWITLSLKLQQA